MAMIIASGLYLAISRADSPLAVRQIITLALIVKLSWTALIAKASFS